MKHIAFYLNKFFKTLNNIHHDIKLDKKMTNLIFSQVEKEAIIEASKIYINNGEYFTIYGNTDRKYTTDEAVDNILNNPSNPQWVGFETEVVPSFYSWEEPKKFFVAKLSPKKKFHLTRGEGWRPEFTSGDLREVEEAKRRLPHKWQREEYLIIEEDIPNPF